MILNTVQQNCQSLEIWNITETFGLWPALFKNTAEMVKLPFVALSSLSWWMAQGGGGGGGVLRGTSDWDDRRIFLVWKFWFQVFWGRKNWQVLSLGWLDLIRDFGGYSKQSKIRGSVCISWLHSSMNKVQPMTTRWGKIKFRWYDEKTNTNVLWHLILSWIFQGSRIRHGILLGLIFGGFVGSPRDFLGFWFCFHSFVPIT